MQVARVGRAGGLGVDRGVHVHLLVVGLVLVGLVALGLAGAVAHDAELGELFVERGFAPRAHRWLCSPRDLPLELGVEIRAPVSHCLFDELVSDPVVLKAGQDRALVIFPDLSARQIYASDPDLDRGFSHSPRGKASRARCCP